MGEFAKALYFKMKMVAIREKVLSADHVDLATSYNNLAATYFYLGNFKKCKEYRDSSIKCV
ncbi:MAG: tetratricopeptide repeat protein [Lewinellaceae bacterium]|nr:tetratricopeptide repeat protein [Lewinellaceae bacterium]